MATNDGEPVNMLPFQDLTVTLERLSKAKKPHQGEILEEFIAKIKLTTAENVDKKSSSIYPVLRLLLSDYEKRSYNLKESKLGDLLVRVLSINKQSREGQKLLNYRSENKSQDCDLAGAAYFVVSNLGVCPTSGSLTIGDINDALDKVSNAEVGNKRCVLDEIFSNVLKNSTATQVKWFLRFILKKLRIGMSLRRILYVYHPDAYALYENCSNLSKVCEEFDDGNARPPELGLQLFFAVCPMLSERLDVTKVSQTLSPNKTYILENKFDGERFQIHMQDGVFEYFSRRSYSYSDNYGKTYESGLLTPYLKDCFGPSVASFVLDGEMMGWDKKLQSFGCKGMPFDIKKVTENSRFRPCFCAFDVLFYNGKSLVGGPERGGLPLRERLKILDAVFKDVRGVINHSERQQVKNSSDILDALNEAIDKEEEGLVVKDIESYYIANKRNAGWYKIKPEYTESSMTDLDLVIVGADESEDKSHGTVRSYHVACLDDAEGRWVCVGRVSGRLQREKRDLLEASLRPHWNRVRQCAPPNELYFNKELPDWWLPPERSCVLQIRATELVRSTSYGAAYTLRFPRVQRVRDDKPVRDACTLQQLYALLDNKKCVNKLSTNQIGVDQMNETNLGKSHKRSAKMPQVADSFKTKSDGAVSAVSQALLGRKICILSDDEDCSKEEIAKMVLSHSGKLTENPDEAFCCVMGRRTQRALNVIESQASDVVHTSWLRQISAQPAALQPLEALQPLDVLAPGKDSALRLSRDFDVYGDSYTQPLDVDTLRKCFNKMEQDLYLTTREMSKIDRELFADGEPLSFLRGCVIHSSNSSVNAILAKMYGASVCDKDCSDLTHFILSDDGERSNVPKSFNGVVVTEDWLEACVTKKKWVSEDKFRLCSKNILSIV